MLTSDFDYDLPEDRIAQEPAPRGESRLLVLDAEGPERHRRVRDLPALLRPNDLLVLNDTRVIPARLFGRRGEGKMEVLLVEKLGDRDWEALVRPGKRAKPGTEIVFDGLSAEVVEKREDRYRLRFSEAVEPHLDRLGHIPLPPYIHRPDEAADRERYQTVFARAEGSVAAPTAGLHFTPALLDQLRARGASIATVVLHVGVGTFRPVEAEDPAAHIMHAEWYEVTESQAQLMNETRARGGKLWAVGTTVTRTLESAADERGIIQPGSAWTKLFIRPGYRFRAVDHLITNFHLPRSTLLMLVAAFAGHERVMRAYADAVRERYRFYSYGDAMAIL